MNTIIYKWDYCYNYPTKIEVYKLNIDSEIQKLFTYTHLDNTRLSKFVSLLQEHKIQINGIYTINPIAFLFAKDLFVEFFNTYQTFKEFIFMYDGVLYSHNTAINMIEFYKERVAKLKNFDDKSTYMNSFQTLFFKELGIVDIDSNHAYMD